MNHAEILIVFQYTNEFYECLRTTKFIDYAQISLEVATNNCLNIE